MLSATLRAGLVLACVASACSDDSRYGFYRRMGKRLRKVEALRVSGGAAAPISTFSAACALLDYNWTVHCSATVLAPYWALTAAHCLSTNTAYVKYNSASAGGDISAVRYVYRHPDYKILEADDGGDEYVTLLHHDVGLLRTHTAMELDTPLPLDPLNALFLYNLKNLTKHEVQVLGFGLTEMSSIGEELFEVRLQLVFCGSRPWVHCMCGVSKDRGSNVQGVCSGDSGGPVLFRGALVGVTSMGSISCTDEVVDSSMAAIGVFTSLHQYANLVNDTIHDTKSAMRMRRVYEGRAGAPQPRGAPLALAAGAGVALLTRPCR